MLARWSEMKDLRGSGFQRSALFFGFSGVPGWHADAQPTEDALMDDAFMTVDADERG